MRTSLTAMTALIALIALLIGNGAQAQALSYLGQQHVVTGTQFAGTTVGGLSGIDFDATTGRFVAISDDRSAANPARFYSLNLDLAAFRRSATPGSAGVAFQSVTTILNSDGNPFALNAVDPEAIRRLADGRLAWSNEGQRSAAGFQAPTIRLMNADGSFAQSFALPTGYLPSGSVGGLSAGDAGIRNNLAFESLSLSPDGRTLWTATENALAQDGPPATVANGSRSRLLSFDMATGQAGAEFIYEVDPVQLAPQPAGGFATNGLVELLALGEQEFIAVERSFAVGAQTPGTPVTGNSIRLFHVDSRQASNVAGLTDTGSATALRKTLLLDLATLRNDDGSALALDNIEGISWGPMVDGKRTLILVSDNNFSATQFTQFVALSVNSPIPEPASALLLGAGLVLLAARRRGENAGHAPASPP